MAEYIVTPVDAGVYQVTIPAAPNITINTSSQAPIILSVPALQGPPGAGATGNATALEDIGGHRVICQQGLSGAIYADNTVLAKANSVLGVTTGAANNGANIQFVRQGTITEPSWNFVPDGLVFLGTNGLLTQVPPVAPAFLVVIGCALTATSLRVNIQPPLILS